MTTDRPHESKVRWLLRFLALGTGASIAAVGVALLVALVFDPSWTWSRIAIVLLGPIASLLIVATTSAGSGTPTAMGYDRFDAHIEMQGKQMSGAPLYEPAQAGLDALFAILPPFVTTVALLVIFGF